jgi:hypothetical protein
MPDGESDKLGNGKHRPFAGRTMDELLKESRRLRQRSAELLEEMQVITEEMRANSEMLEGDWRGRRQGSNGHPRRP